MGIRLIRKSSWERTEKANRKALRPRSLQGALREAKAALGRAKRFHAEGPGAVMVRGATSTKLYCWIYAFMSLLSALLGCGGCFWLWWWLWFVVYAGTC